MGSVHVGHEDPVFALAGFEQLVLLDFLGRQFLAWLFLAQRHEPNKACSIRPAGNGIRIPRQRPSWAMTSIGLGAIPRPTEPSSGHRLRTGHRILHTDRRLPGSKNPNRPARRSASLLAARTAEIGRASCRERV